MESLDTLSIIIPTYNRFASLQETLASLGRQTTTQFEVVIVDDGSTDCTYQVAEETYPFHLCYVRQQNQGSAAARNHGARISRGDVLVFIDDDITLEPGYLQAIAQAHHEQARLISMGVFLPYLTGQDSAFARLCASELGAKAACQTDQLVSFTECTSNDLAVARQDFIDLGMWQDVLGDGPTLWGDVDFGYRAWKQNFRFVLVAGAKLYHRDVHTMSLSAACKRAYHVSRTVHVLFQRYPEIKQRLSMFWYKEPISPTDPLPLMARKVLRKALFATPTTRGMEGLTKLLETLAPSSFLLASLYHWVVSAYIYQGYHQGLRALSKDCSQ